MENIRNFCIISHVDHGKSTLADRFLELTNTVPKNKMREQFLDSMDLERERGITIKMQPVRMNYTLNNKLYILNLIDTPGHVDFNYEVSRSLAAVEGVVLLVDATKGIQAQTISNLELAKKQNLVIIPAVNKIDSPQARIEDAKKETASLLDIQPEEVFEISAKLGNNVENLLNFLIEKIPHPRGDLKKPFRALIFDSKYDPYKGVIAYLRVADGEASVGENIHLIQAETKGEVKETGYFKPAMTTSSFLKAGEIGYMATGIKESEKVRIGDTITTAKDGILPLPGYSEPKAMVFLSVYPEDSDDLDLLKEALGKLKLNDASLTFRPELKEGLGRGFQCGFLGLLHAEIVTERLKREFDLKLILSTPSVIFKCIGQDGKEIFVNTASDWSEESAIRESLELWVKLQILTPLSYLGAILDLFKNIEAKYITTNYLVQDKGELTYEVPLREIISKNFYDKLKSVSQGFASMNYEVLDWRKADLVKVDILILGRKEDILSIIVPERDAYKEGKKIVEKLKEILPPQLFALPLQAAIGGKIIARETIKAQRRDVIAPLYGGDYTRKRKLLERQKKGKKDLKEKGRIRIPPDIFLEIFKSS